MMNRQNYLSRRASGNLGFDFLFEAHVHFHPSNHVSQEQFLQLFMQVGSVNPNLLAVQTNELVVYFDNLFELKILSSKDGIPILMY